MDATFKKLNYKQQKNVFVLNAPKSFDENLKSIAQEASIHTQVKANDKIEFVIGFATKQQEINDMVTAISPLLVGDAIVWLCYPKMSSKKYTCEFNRDNGWDIAGKYSLEGVRQVAIDEDWSALRFRKVSYIKSFTRDEKMALSAEGKKRTKSI